MDYFIDFANYKDTEVYFPGCGLIPLSRGQHIFGYRKVSEFLNMGMSMCVRKIKLLETIGFMTIKATNKYSIATIINYDTYQSDSCVLDKQTDKQATKRRQTGDKQTELPNKDKKDKKEKNIITYPDWLDMNVWNEYKKYRQTGKNKFTPYAQKLAIKKLLKLKESGNDPNEVICRSMECGWTGLFELKENKKSENQRWIEQA